ncbi:T9SS type A sorting domain-containing protein [Hymenobacter sp. B81]|uniref:T9SS type A sorting domain-containing protein n=1 Tax=Hymenobacter sp. B81 TaxID=3344878 RepID=UPI0037DDD804
MKQLFLFALLLGLVGRSYAQQQVPNASLDSWQTRNGVEVPTSWTTTDEMLAQGGIPIPLGAVTKTNDVHGGAFAARLETKSFFGFNLPGFLILGTRIDTANSRLGGVPYTSRPTKVQFWYKFTGTATDSAQAIVALSQGAGAQQQTIGGGAVVLRPSATYRLAEMPIGYVAPQAPDTLIMYFATGTDFSQPSTGVLQIDDIVMSNAPITANREPALTGVLAAYPNPSQDGRFRLRAERDFDVAAAAFTVTDAAGRVVLRQPAISPAAVGDGREIDLHGRPAGVYALQLETPRGTVVRRLLVR